MRLTIKAKLAGGFASVLVLTGVAGGIGYQKLTAADEAMKFVLGRSEVQMLVLDAKANAIRGISNTRAAVISADDAQMADFSKRASENRNDALAAMAKAKTYINSEEGKRFFEDLSDKYDKQRALAAKVLELTRLNSNSRTWTEIDTTGRPATVALRAELEALVKGRPGETGDDELSRAAAGFQVRLERAWGQMQSATGALSVEALEQRVSTAKQAREEISRAMDDLLRVAAARGLRVEEIRQKYGAWSASFQKALATVETGSTIRAASLASGDYAVASTTAIRAFDALAEFQNKRMTDAVARAKAESSEGQTILLAVLAGALLLGFAIATWLAVTISRGLSRAVSLADAVAMGDLSRTVTVTSRDELGDLVTAMNRMTANLNATAGVADAIAEGDLTVETKPLSEKDRMGLALEQMLARLRAVVADASAAANNVSAGSQELSASAEQLSQGSTEQAASTEEASASMEEMAANVKQNAENAG
ncbi:MCP four helix bundle domain-containing protein, partial [Methylobacterium tarhaniae]|uniref:MCP four helix bundle domain-containing protein n=1 Tax=Methylobacterium tarhaniae TaxID=1187852 RepID=UPI003CFEB913